MLKRVAFGVVLARLAGTQVLEYTPQIPTFLFQPSRKPSGLSCILFATLFLPPYASQSEFRGGS